MTDTLKREAYCWLPLISDAACGTDAYQSDSREILQGFESEAKKHKSFFRIRKIKAIDNSSLKYMVAAHKFSTYGIHLREILIPLFLQEGATKRGHIIGRNDVWHAHVMSGKISISPGIGAPEFDVLIARPGKSVLLDCRYFDGLASLDCMETTVFVMNKIDRSCVSTLVDKLTGVEG